MVSIETANRGEESFLFRHNFPKLTILSEVFDNSPGPQSLTQYRSV